jgi:hypothetical protein
LGKRRFIVFFAATTVAAALAACSNPTQGAHVTDASVLPYSSHQLAKIPVDSLFIGGTNRISVFSNAAGGWAPTSEITSHVTREPRAMGIDPDGDLIVANYADEQSQMSLYRLSQDGKYVGGLTKGINRPTALALDEQGNLAVVTHNDKSLRTVRVFPSAASDRSYELEDTGSPWCLLYDESGELFVANQGHGRGVGIYKPSEPRPVQTFRDGLLAPVALAFDRTGELYVANVVGFDVTAYKGPDYKLVLTIPTGGLRPVSLATMGNHLYIAAVSQLKSVVLDYNLNTGRSTRIVDGIDNPIQVMICSQTYVCVANSNHKVTIYQADELVHTIDIQRPIWSMTTR